MTQEELQELLCHGCFFFSFLFSSLFSLFFNKMGNFGNFCFFYYDLLENFGRSVIERDW
jgi:hypothetical protein